MERIDRSRRFCQEDLTGIAVYRKVMDIIEENDSYTSGFRFALYSSDDEAINLLNKEKNSNDGLQEVWKMAEDTLDLKKNFKHLNPLSSETKLALRAYTIDKPFYKEFNSKTRTLITFSDWENFSYKGVFLLLFKAISSPVGRCTPTVLYRGIDIKTNINVGEDIRFQQFTSTTSNRSKATDGFICNEGTLFIFSNVTQALGINCLSAFEDEEEFLILPSDLFSVERKEINEKVLEIYLESKNQSSVF